ncbi:MAG: hypothetical protein INQ03_05880 [Candidatus Heimdallarchaeota archaeon]|nr:hypothetical protein [Candidatus Heimdallarchaeota archaeon]
MKVNIALLFIILMIHAVSAQNMDPDSEVVDLQARVTDIGLTWEYHNYTNDEGSQVDTYLEFDLILEIWNPYNHDVTDFGSSSCHWPAGIDPHFNTSLEYENWGQICTDDYSPIVYSSGISEEFSAVTLVFVYTYLEEYPDGNIYVIDANGNFTNNSDPFYGANIRFENGSITIEYEAYPRSWGLILYSDIRWAPHDLTSILIGITMVSLMRKYQN